MDSIKFRSVHLMDDGDGHHNFGIDGDGDGHHFKGDGRHVWSTQNRKFVLFYIVLLSPFMVMYQCLNGAIPLKECSIMAPTIIE